MEQIVTNLDNNRPSQPVTRPQTYDDDQEPIRPNMSGDPKSSLPLQQLSVHNDESYGDEEIIEVVDDKTDM
jgi:hypothetical protein